jgi:RNA 3'-terminal phosphate cyclase (ATP)
VNEVRVDGSTGEGGGQVLRTSLSLSLVTGRPLHVRRIRAGRRKPGLQRQHLAAVRAAATVGNAEVEGDAVGSQELRFRPRGIVSGNYRFDVGSAGSATLVLQTVLPALLTGVEPSRIELEGGTHNPLSPPFDFLAGTYLPLVSRMGPQLTAVLDRPGFYPKGGGRFRVEVVPSPELRPLELEARGELRAIRAVVRVAAIPGHVAEREARVIEEGLDLRGGAVRIESLDRSWGPGNVVIVHVGSDALVETFSGFGERGVRAEDVASRVVGETCRYLRAGVAAGEHLADQLLLLNALAGGGSFTTVALSPHATTQLEVIPLFLDVRIEAKPIGPDAVVVSVYRT